MLLSTRDLQISKEVDVSYIVNFEERDDVVAEEMLCEHTEVKKDWIDIATQGVKDAVNGGVRRCGGLPVALGVAGKGIRSIAIRRSANVEEKARGFYGGDCKVQQEARNVFF